MMDLLAKEYLDRAENYDRMVCTGPIGADGIRPATGAEHAQISAHARVLMRELCERAQVDHRELRARIHEEGRHYKYNPDDLILPEMKRIDPERAAETFRKVGEVLARHPRKVPIQLLSGGNAK